MQEVQEDRGMGAVDIKINKGVLWGSKSTNTETKIGAVTDKLYEFNLEQSTKEEYDQVINGI